MDCIALMRRRQKQPPNARALRIYKNSKFVPAPIIRGMRFHFAILLSLVLQTAVYSQTPVNSDDSPILVVNRNTAKAGDLEKFESELRKKAQRCAKIGYPHSYLVFQSSLDRNEMWGLTTWASLDDEKKMEAYAEKAIPPLFPRLGLRMTRSSWFTYRPDLSRGTQWKMGQDRLLIATSTNNSEPLDGTVFEAGGTRIAISPARDEVDAIARLSSPDSVVLVLRPELSFPAKEWIDASPQLWVPPASSKDIRRVIAADGSGVRQKN